jgi:hypothetical protein
VVRDTYGQLNTDLERQAFFDEFLKNQRRGFPSAWVAIYETVDLIRQADWYWKGQGFDSFDAFWQQQGEQLFGRWADLEATYQYAHLAAPHLFEVEYDDAKALAQQLRVFSSVPPANPNGVRNPGGKRGPARLDGVRKPGNPVDPRAFMPELNSDDWQDGYNRGRLASKDAAGDSFKRFARLRRDAPDVADQFLAGQFVRKFKNNRPPVPDLKAAEIAAGIRKEGQTTRQRDGLAYARKLISKFSKDDLRALQQHITTLLQQD